MLKDKQKSFEQVSDELANGVEASRLFEQRLKTVLNSLKSNQSVNLVFLLSLLMHALAVVPLALGKAEKTEVSEISKSVRKEIDKLNDVLESAEKRDYSQKAKESLQHDVRVINNKLRRRAENAGPDKTKQLADFNAKQHDLLMKKGGINNLQIPFIIFERNRLEDLVEDGVVNHGIKNFHSTVKKVKAEVSLKPDESSLTKIVEGSSPPGTYLRTVSTAAESFAIDDEKEQKGNCDAKNDRRIAVLLAIYPDLADKLYLQNFDDHVRPLVYLNGKFYVLDGYYAAELAQDEKTFARNNTIYYYEDDLKVVFGVIDELPQFAIQDGELLNPNQSIHSERIAKDLARKDIAEEDLVSFKDPVAVERSKNGYEHPTDRLRRSFVRNSFVVNNAKTGQVMEFKIDSLGDMESSVSLDHAEDENWSSQLLAKAKQQEEAIEVEILNSCEELRALALAVGGSVDLNNDYCKEEGASRPAQKSVETKSGKILDAEVFRNEFLGKKLTFDEFTNKLSDFDDMSEEAVILVVDNILSSYQVREFDMVSFKIKNPTSVIIEQVHRLKCMTLIFVGQVGFDALSKINTFNIDSSSMYIVSRQTEIEAKALREIFKLGPKMKHYSIDLSYLNDLNADNTNGLDEFTQATNGFGFERVKYLDEKAAERLSNLVTYSLYFGSLNPISPVTARSLAKVERLRINANALGQNDEVAAILSKDGEGPLVVDDADELSIEAMNGLRSGSRDLQLILGKTVRNGFIDFVRQLVVSRKGIVEVQVNTTELNYGELFKGFGDLSDVLFVKDRTLQYDLPDGRTVVEHYGNGVKRHKLILNTRIPNAAFLDRYMVDLLNFPGEIVFRGIDINADRVSKEAKDKLRSAKGRVRFDGFDSKGWSNE